MDGMKKKSMSFICTLFCLLLGIVIFLGMSLCVYAEGSRDLINSAAGQGDRAYIEYQGDNMLSVGLQRQQYVNVYMFSGETAYFGSSVAKAGSIEVTDPKGETVLYDVNAAGNGFIGSITSEAAGPNYNGLISGGYNPISFVADRNGIYKFIFYSSNYSSSKPNNSTNPTATKVSDDNFVANQKDAAIGAWDVTVVGTAGDGTAEVKTGRMYADYLSLNMGANERSLYSKVYVLTSDRYIYYTDFNGIDPFGFTFFGNNRGLVSSRTNMSLYHSMEDAITSGNTPDLNNFRDITDKNGAKDGMYLPGPGNTSTQLDSSFKIFFNEPSGELPDSIKPAPQPPGTIDYLKFEGSVLDSNGNIIENEGYVGGGGYFIINASKVSNFEVKIDLSNIYYKTNTEGKIDENNFIYEYPVGSGNYMSMKDDSTIVIDNISEYINAGTVVIGNSCVEGINRIFWNGCDENGRVLPAGTYFEAGKGNAVAIPKAGEYHFPLIDVENLPNGLKITRLNTPDTFSKEQRDFVDNHKSYLYYNNIENSVLRTGNYNGVDRQKIWTVADKLNKRSGVNTEVSGACIVTGRSADKTVLDFWTDLRLSDDAGTKSNPVELIDRTDSVESMLLAGFTFFDYDFSGTYDMLTNDYALSNVKVELLDNSGNSIAETVSDSRGFYTFVVPDKSAQYTIKVTLPNDTYFCTTANMEQSTVPQDIVVGQTASVEDVGFLAREASPIRINKTWAVPDEEQPKMDVEFLIEGRDQNGDENSPVLYSRTAVVKDSEGYSTLVEGLPAVIFVNGNEVDLSYTVKEVTDIPGFTGTITSETGGLVWDCVNKPEDISFTVEKTWSVASNFTKPDDITVSLMKKNEKGELVKVDGVQDQPLNNSNNWKATFEPVPKYEEYVENGAAKYRAIDYTVVENNIPSGFAASIQKSAIETKTNTFIVTNTAEGSVKLIKVDKETSSPLPGAEFKLVQLDEDGISYLDVNKLKPVYDSLNEIEKYQYDENSTIDKLVTNKNGEIIVENLSMGTYNFIETKAPEGYITPAENEAKSSDMVLGSGVNSSQVKMENSLNITPTPIPTATSAPTETPMPTATATPEPTATATPVPTATATPEPTATVTPEPTATVTPEPTATAEPEPTATVTPEPTATTEPEPTATAEPEPTVTAEPEPTATATPEPTVTAEPEPTATTEPEPTATAEPEPTATAEPEPTATAGPQPGDIVSINVSKIWEDAEGTASLTPPAELDGSQIEIVLIKNGVRTEQSLVLNNENGFNGSFNNLNRFDESGNVIDYSVQEVNAPFGYCAFYENDGINSWTVTNAQANITGKVFYDALNNGVYDLDTDSFIKNAKVVLEDENGNQVGEAVLTDENGYYFFSRVPVNDDGTETKYTVRVISPLNDVKCTTTETGNQTEEIIGGSLNVTQSVALSKTDMIIDASDTGLYGDVKDLEEQNINVAVKKVWEDNNNRKGKRPQELEVYYSLKNKEGIVIISKTLILNEENNWQEEFIMPYRAIEDSEVVETQVDGYKEPKITSTVDKESEKFIITVRNSIVSNSSSGGNGGKPTGGSTGTETGAPWPTSTAKPNPNVSATPKPEIPELDKTNHYAYIIGYPEGDVRPQNDISRDEVATIFFRMLTDDSRNEFWMITNPYTDVPADMWSNNAISTMSNAKILTGDPDGKFRPADSITRGEFAAIAARFSSKEYNGENMFTDIIGHWSEEYINRAAQEGWISGYPDGSFKPDQYITRAEAMTLVNNILNRHAKESGLLNDMLKWPDNVPGEWYYTAVQEATNSHYYDRDSDGYNETWTEIREPRDWVQLEKTWSDANSAGSEDSVYSGE